MFDHTRVLEGLEKLAKAGAFSTSKDSTNLAKGGGGLAPDVMANLAKSGVDTAALATLVPQDLERMAHNTTWRPDSPYELTFLKTIPRTPATAIRHEFVRFNGYSNRKRIFGNFSERALPASSRFEAARRYVDIKLVGEMSDVYLLAALEQTINALGTSGAAQIEANALQFQVLGRKQQAFLFSRTDTVRLGSASTRVRGLVQAIQEGTDGTEDSSPIGSHVIDLEGKPLTQAIVRQYTTEVIKAYGLPNTLYMSPDTRAGFEASLDGSYWTPLPFQGTDWKLGTPVRGFRSQTAEISFITDNLLQPDHKLSPFGRYTTELDEAAPTTRPTINSCVASTASPTKWDAASAGDIFYFVTETVNEYESLGSRYPATVGTYLTVAADQIVTFSVTPGTPTADSFRVYRGKSGDGLGETPYFAFEVANGTTGGAVTFVDRNYDRPGTDYAFMLSVNSDAQRAIASGETFANLAARSEDFFNQPDDEMSNTVCFAELGQRLMHMQLAAILPTVSRPLMASAMTAQVRQPRKNIVFKNVGRA